MTLSPKNTKWIKINSTVSCSSRIQCTIVALVLEKQSEFKSLLLRAILKGPVMLCLLSFFYLKKKIKTNQWSKPDRWKYYSQFFLDLHLFCLICRKGPLLGSQTEVKRLYYYIMHS